MSYNGRQPRESDENTSNRNPRYKGNNYDPNYKAKQRGRNFTFQEYVTQQREANGQRNHFADTSHHTTPQHGRYRHPFQQHVPQTRIPNAQPHQSPNATSLPMLFLTQFCQEVGQILKQDWEGDSRMCDCPNPAGTTCFHAIAELYQNHLVQSAKLQHDIVDFFTFLMSRDQALQQIIMRGILEYVENKPETLLRRILETMGREGLVTLGVGTFSGPGVRVVTDKIVNSNSLDKVVLWMQSRRVFDASQDACLAGLAVYPSYATCFVNTQSRSLSQPSCSMIIRSTASTSKGHFSQTSQCSNNKEHHKGKPWSQKSFHLIEGATRYKPNIFEHHGIKTRTAPQRHRRQSKTYQKELASRRLTGAVETRLLYEAPL
ncbi:hypothetical protein F4823DRAFT_637581 [Ustulina deusta]|nr:hypothetical protein F4823DRAFT_637581 [Ustulina deusta]